MEKPPENRNEQPVTRETVLKKVERIIEQIKRMNLTAIALSLAMSTNPAGSSEKDYPNNTGKEFGYGKETEEFRKELIEQIGFDIFSLAEKNGFQVEIPIRNRNGKYLLHIGQIHSIPSEDKKRNGKEYDLARHIGPYVIKSQIEIEGVLKGIINSYRKKGYLVEDEPLFVVSEGYTLSIEEITYLNYLFDSKNNPVVLDDLRTNNPKSPLNQGVEKWSLSSSIIKNDFYQNFNLPTPPNRPKMDYSQFGENATYLAGGDIKLHLEGEVFVLPGEDEHTSDEANNALQELEKCITEKGQDGCEVEAKNYEKYVLDEREEVAVKIAQQLHLNNKWQGPVMPLIYGDYHDMTTEVTSSNKSGEKFGLIKLKSRQQKIPLSVPEESPVGH